jgi:hypothetical protein
LFDAPHFVSDPNGLERPRLHEGTHVTIGALENSCNLFGLEQVQTWAMRKRPRGLAIGVGEDVVDARLHIALGVPCAFIVVDGGTIHIVHLANRRDRAPQIGCGGG